MPAANGKSAREDLTSSAALFSPFLSSAAAISPSRMCEATPMPVIAMLKIPAFLITLFIVHQLIKGVRFAPRAFLKLNPFKL